MRIALMAGGFLIATAFMAGSAAAGQGGSVFWRYYDYPWCLNASTGLNECSYTTLQQCLVSRSGVGGSCTPNPRYSDAARKPSRRPTGQVYR